MNEDRWAHNVLLVGDEHWNCLRTADDDVAKEVKRLESESKLNFRVASKPGETIERLYDVIRGKLLFAVPPRVQKVVVSVGAKDLLDPQLMTLSQGSLGDVRKNNSAYLTPKATALREMAAYLLNQKKTVILFLRNWRHPHTLRGQGHKCSCAACVIMASTSRERGTSTLSDVPIAQRTHLSGTPQQGSSMSGAHVTAS